MIFIKEDAHPHPTIHSFIKNVNPSVYIGRVLEGREKKNTMGREAKSHHIQCLFSLWIVVKNDLTNHLIQENDLVSGNSLFYYFCLLLAFPGPLIFPSAIGILSESVAGKRSLSWMHNTVYSTWDQK